MSRMRSLLWKLERHRSRFGDAAFLGRLLPNEQVSGTLIETLLAEVRNAPELAAAVSSWEAKLWAAPSGQVAADGEVGVRDAVDARLDLSAGGRARTLLLYAALRILRPRVVVETGCFTGWDTTVILAALARNDLGHLHTIDLPGYADRRPDHAQFQASLSHGGLPRELGPGFLVPDELQDRWSLELGNARQLLPRLLRRVPAIDVFFHDSEHSYEHMMWEYTTVFPHLDARKGLLISDDLSFNTAFWDFCSGVGCPLVMHRGNANIGAMVRGCPARGPSS